MPQPRRYTLISWNTQAGRGIATDGTKYQGEPIEFIVFGRDLDPEYNGVLYPGEEFYANDSPNFILYDVVVESGPRGLISQSNFEGQAAAKIEADKKTPKVIITEAEYQRLASATTIQDQQKVVEDLTPQETEDIIKNWKSYTPSLTVDVPTPVGKALDYKFKFTGTPYPGEVIEDNGYVPMYAETDVEYLQNHVRHLEDILTKQTIQLLMIETYLGITVPSWRDIASAENKRQVLANQPSVATPDLPVEKVDPFEERVERADEGIQF